MPRKIKENSVSKQLIKEIEDIVRQAAKQIIKSVKECTETKINDLYLSVRDKQYFYWNKKDIKGKSFVLVEWYDSRPIAYSVHSLDEVNDMYKACQTEEGKKWPVRINDLYTIGNVDID